MLGKERKRQKKEKMQVVAKVHLKIKEEMDFWTNQ